jgi:hypothetical protein
VCTAALGEGIERTVRFDNARIIHDRLEEVTITETRVSPTDHYTEIVLDEPHHLPVGRTLGKMRSTFLSRSNRRLKRHS